jgi:hypothetical protein
MEIQSILVDELFGVEATIIVDTKL